MNTKKLKNESMVPFYLVSLYLLFEFGRPQVLLPILGKLRLPAITIILLSIWIIIKKKINLKNNVTLLFVLLMCEMIIHGPIAVNNHYAFWIFYSMMINLIAYLGISNIIDSDIKYYKLINIFLIIFIFLSIVGLVKGGRGIGGFIGDENDFCMALNMIFPFALFSIFASNSIHSKMYYMLLAALFLVINVITLSRGGFIGLSAVFFYCWLRSNKKIALMLIMGILVIIALILAPPSYMDEIRSIGSESSNTQGTGAQRLYSWKVAWGMFLHNPIIGVGQGNYPWNVKEIEDIYGLQWQERSMAARVAHSLYFTLLPELGLIGLCIFIAMNVSLFKKLNNIIKLSKLKNELISVNESKVIYFHALALEASLIGFLISSIFISTLYYPNFYVLCGFVVAYNKIISVKYNKLTNNVMFKTKIQYAHV